MNDTPPQHSGSRWEPGTSGEPTVPLGGRPAGPPLPPVAPGCPAWPAPGLQVPDLVQAPHLVPAQGDRRGRGRPLLLVAVVAVLALLTTGGWVALSALQRHGDDPVAGTSQGPFAGSDQGRRDGDQPGLLPRDRTGIDPDSDGDGAQRFDRGGDGDDAGGAGASDQRQFSGDDGGGDA